MKKSTIFILSALVLAIAGWGLLAWGPPLVALFVFIVAGVLDGVGLYFWHHENE